MNENMLKIVSLPVESIEQVPVQGERAVRFIHSYDEKQIASLAESMEEVGLKTPITVYAVGDKYALLCGGYRLEAARLLGWTHIDCIVTEEDETIRRMWQISENLHRTNRPRLERYILLSEWVELRGQRVSAQSAPKPQGGRPQGGTRAAARELGLDRDYVRRAIKIASLSQDAKETARVLGLHDHKKALLEAADQPEDKQSAFLLEFAKSLERKMPCPLAARTESRQYSALNKAWKNAGVFVVDEFMRDNNLVYADPERPQGGAPTQQPEQKAPEQTDDSEGIEQGE